MHRPRLLVGWLSALSILVTGMQAHAAGPDEPVAAPKPDDLATAARFMRVTHDDKQKPLALQTAVKRYGSPGDDALSVDLIAAVHVADAEYYDRLNREFEKYDALLYELVKPPGAKPSRQALQANRSTLSSLQTMLKDVLQLEFQLEQIDYDKANFVHADMSPKQFSQSMKKKGESPLTIFLQLLKASAAQQFTRKAPPPDTAVILAALLDRKRGAPVLKRIVADELSEADVMLEALNGEQGSTLITERNKVALDVLDEQIRAGKKRIGIFYGSGHMLDMEKRLTERFGLTLKETRWITAWDLKVTEAEIAPRAPARKSPKIRN